VRSVLDAAIAVASPLTRAPSANCATTGSGSALPMPRMRPGLTRTALAATNGTLGVPE
jgi:hypothetical protein